MILKQFLDNISSTYLIFMELDAIHKLADIEEEILIEEKKFLYF